MSVTAMTWLKAFHLFGAFLWMGTLIGLSNILLAHAAADLGARPAFHKLERKVAMMMDLGATLAIGFGIWLIIQTPGAMKQGSLHAKLALVVLGPLAVHGMLRVKVRRFREGKVVAPPGFLPPVLMLLGLAIIVLVVVKPF